MNLAMSDFTGTLKDRSYDQLFKWFLFTGVVCIGAVVLWDYGYLGYLFTADNSGISAVIVALFVVLSLHCLYILVDLSPELQAVERATEEAQAGALLEFDGTGLRVGGHRMPPGRFVTAHLGDIAHKQRMDPSSGSREILAEALNAQLRKRLRFGIFMSDVLYKLGLLGTVIGFILMLSSMGDLGEFEVETMRTALQAMTGGMAVSLLTTIAGLVCGTLLRLEYVFVESLIGSIVQRTVRLTEVFVVPAINQARGDV